MKRYFLLVFTCVFVVTAQNQDSMELKYDAKSFESEEDQISVDQYIDTVNVYEEESENTEIAKLFGFINAIPLSVACDSMNNKKNKKYLFYVDNSDGGSIMDPSYIWTLTQKVECGPNSQFPNQSVLIFNYFHPSVRNSFVGIIPRETDSYRPGNYLNQHPYEFISVAEFKKLDGFSKKIPILRQLVYTKTMISKFNSKYPPQKTD